MPGFVAYSARLLAEKITFDLAFLLFYSLGIKFRQLYSRATSKTYMQRIHYFYAALIGYFGLFFLQLAWHTVLFPLNGFPTAFLLIISVGPILLPFRGLLHGNLKSCTWMTYLSLPYFMHGVAEAYAS